MFEYKSLKEVSEMSIEEQSAYQIAKETHENSVRKAELEKAINESTDKTNAELETLKTQLKEQSEVFEKNMLQLKAMSEKPSKAEKVNSLSEEVKANKEAIKNIAFS